jgi:hypothetical protein
MADRPDDPARTTAQQAGDAAETLVAARLAEAGWTVLAGRHRPYESGVAVVRAPPRWSSSRSLAIRRDSVA